MEGLVSGGQEDHPRRHGQHRQGRPQEGGEVGFYEELTRKRNIFFLCIGIDGFEQRWKKSSSSSSGTAQQHTIEFAPVLAFKCTSIKVPIFLPTHHFAFSAGTHLNKPTKVRFLELSKLKILCLKFIFVLKEIKCFHFSSQFHLCAPCLLQNADPSCI